MLAEFLSQDESGRRIVHLVNLRQEPQRNCKVEVRLDEVQEIKVLYPPTDVPPQWQVKRGADGTQVIFDLLDTYAAVVIQ